MIIGFGFSFKVELIKSDKTEGIEELGEAKKWWILSHYNYGDPGIFLYNETTDQIEKHLPLPNPELSAHSLDYDGESLWVSGALPSKNNPHRQCDTLYQINPEDGSILSTIPNIRTQGVSVSNDYIYHSGWSFSRAAIYTMTKEGEPVDTFQTEELIHSLEVVEGIEMYAMTANPKSPLLRIDVTTEKMDTIFLPGHESRRNIIIEGNEIVTIEGRGNNTSNFIKRYNKETFELISSKQISLGGWLTAFAPAKNSICPGGLDVLSNNKLPSDTLLCKGESVRLEYDIPDAMYNWQDGSTANYFDAIGAGQYVVEICLQGCTVLDTINVASSEVTDFIFGDTIICPENEILINSSFTADTYIWNDGSTSNELTVNEPGEYWLETEIDGCVFRDSIEIFPSNTGCNCSAYIPNVFNPNNAIAPNNASFQVFLNCQVDNFEFTLYDRWGGKIWTTNDPNKKWDGTMRGSPVNSSVLSYTLKYRFVDDITTNKETGSIELID